MKKNTIPTLHLNTNDQELLYLALSEDLGSPYCDLSSEVLFSENTQPQTARLISKHAGSFVLCGLPLINELFKLFGAQGEYRAFYQDGDHVPPAACIAELTALPQVLLPLERTVLNFLQRLSGIATLTAAYVEAVKGTGCKVLDTRKTSPGMRHLEKYAVQCGGGVNHRQGLYDAIMLKDTHIDLCGGMKKALDCLPENSLLPVIIEVRDLKELRVVLACHDKRIDRVLLDNMEQETLIQAIALSEDRFEIEASGGINLKNVREIADTGVHYVSVGALTHSAPNIDLSMKI